MAPDDPSAEDIGRAWAVESAFTAENVRILVNQSGGLIRHSRRLASMARGASGSDDIVMLATAAILVSAAAVEATLAEYGRHRFPSWDRKFYRMSVAEKYMFVKSWPEGPPPQAEWKCNKNVAAATFDEDHPDVSELIGCRIAIAHSEPDNPRSRSYGERINVRGAFWAAESAEKFARAVWGAKMPDWLKSDIGLT